MFGRQEATALFARPILSVGPYPYNINRYSKNPLPSILWLPLSQNIGLIGDLGGLGEQEDLMKEVVFWRRGDALLDHRRGRKTAANPAKDSFPRGQGIPGKHCSAHERQGISVRGRIQLRAHD